MPHYLSSRSKPRTNATLSFVPRFERKRVPLCMSMCMCTCACARSPCMGPGEGAGTCGIMSHAMVAPSSTLECACTAGGKWRRARLLPLYRGVHPGARSTNDDPAAHVRAEARAGHARRPPPRARPQGGELLSPSLSCLAVPNIPTPRSKTRAPSSPPHLSFSPCRVGHWDARIDRSHG